LPIAISFSRYFGGQILNITAKKTRKTDEQDNTTTNESVKEEVINVYSDQIIAKELRQKYVQLLTEYYRSVAKHMIRDYRVSNNKIINQKYQQY
jgi:hypothetical protein